MNKVTNREVAEKFAIIADMIQLKGENIHRVLAYRRASEAIAELPRDLYKVQDEGGLTDIPSIGATLAEKIVEMLTTGDLEFYQRLAAEVPPGVVAMMKVPGMGPKTAARVWKELDITDIPGLKEAAEAGKLRDLSGSCGRVGGRVESDRLA